MYLLKLPVLVDLEFMLISQKYGFKDNLEYIQKDLSVIFITTRFIIASITPLFGNLCGNFLGFPQSKITENNTITNNNY